MKYIGKINDLLFPDLKNGQYYLGIDNDPTSLIKRFLFIGRYDSRLKRMDQIWAMQLNLSLTDKTLIVPNSKYIPDSQVLLETDEFFELTDFEVQMILTDVI